MPPTLPEVEKTNQEKQVDNNGTSAEKPSPKYFFAPLKSKMKSSASAVDEKGERRPDLFVNDIVPSERNRLATIRKPHNPLKCPSNSNAANIDPEVGKIRIKFLSTKFSHTPLFV